MEYSRITDDNDLLYWEIGECAGNTQHLVSRYGRSSNTANTHADQKFTGHFLESEGNLGLYHAQARLYDPEMPRFYGVDAMRSKYPGLSSYVYAANNPLSYIDPDGNDFFRHDETSAILWGNKTDETCEASDGSVCTNIGDTYQFVVDGR